MLRAMYSGISGMRGFQVKLDVIGNNIANVNTFGFKAGRATFKDILSQNVGGAAAPSTATAGIGGINPKQIGLGSAISSIDTIHTQGSTQTTNVPTDLMINGEGFFAVRDGSGNEFYTRAGNFYLDAGLNVNANGYNGLQRVLVNANGLKVQGLTVDNNTGALVGAATNIYIPADAQTYDIDEKGLVSYIPAAGGARVYVGQIQVVKFSNPSGLLKAGSNLYSVSPNSGAVPALADNYAGNKGRGTIIIGALEMSNVELTNEFTEMIVAQRGFQANSRIITTSDEVLQEVVNLKR
ncbi:flagellar hook-basal body complex protein [Effusibacillus lacus]|uniref:Flagellar hook protein FlgE n=1 Tax=Effusibacillus lacus TaxID=1348429 RepID=A0A292YPW6_9BACL|nr:flagellar hook-basal body complex protein [Effusibacillus lacus]TCS73125.1 flagellar hook protein FlgE [Effusibacillus lacus]GAX90530.1 flagellar basal body rod protein FlgG [Effusibacillus lacus]